LLSTPLPATGWISGSAPVGLPWPSIVAFVTLVTNPRIFEHPESIGDAWRQVHAWLACEKAWIPQPTERHAELLGEFLALPGMHRLRKTVATIFILCVVSIGYTAWPLYDLLVLVRAMETRDIETVTRHVYFDAVRLSLTNQLVTPYVRRTGIQISPLAQSMAATALGIANPVAKKLISPEALSELMAVGWPITVVSNPRQVLWG
jgi:Protein of unknown function (DUF2939)